MIPVGMAVALAATLASASTAIEVRHTPVTCVPAGRYARVAAAAGEGVAMSRAELQFRTGADAAWYGVAMTVDSTGWTGVLPRPVTPLARFEYRIILTGTGLETMETAPIEVRVAGPGAPCAEETSASTSVAAPIVVRVPPGAPLMPPVPAGFSPAGVVAAAGPAPRDRWSPVKWAAGALGAAGIGAAAAGVGQGDPPLPEISDIAFSGTNPGPGGDFSWSRDRLTVFVDLTGDPSTPLTFLWFFGLQRPDRQEPCLTMSDTVSVGAGRPVTIPLTAPLRRNEFCLDRYDVVSGKLTILVGGRVVHESVHPLPFRIVP